MCFNPFLANVSVLHTLKTSENVWFSCVFKGYKIQTLFRNALMEKNSPNEFSEAWQVLDLNHNLFYSNVAFTYHLKTFSEVIKMEHWAKMG